MLEKLSKLFRLDYLESALKQEEELLGRHVLPTEADARTATKVYLNRARTILEYPIKLSRLDSLYKRIRSSLIGTH